VYEHGQWKGEKPPILPELGLFEISWRPASSINFEAGRVRFTDPSGFIASGLFDGLAGSAVLGKARLSIGAFYTGFLYKETAKITISRRDTEKYAVPLTFADFETYFASRRALVSLGAEFPDLTSRTTLTLNALAQFDVNDSGGRQDARVHTQYLSVRYTVQPLETLALFGTAVAGLAEHEGDDAIPAHFAAGGGIDWEVPGSLRDMLTLEFRWSSGAVNKNIVAFTPLNSIAQGQVFSPNLSGLMLVRGKYTARLHRTFSASLEGTYFIRTDEETVTGMEYPPSSSRALGGELYGSWVWAPASDFALSAGGGAFFPGTGNVFDTGAPVLWKVTAGIILSL
jgi:hypothetical protein